MESILQSIKKSLGIQSDYTAFDEDIIMHINTVLSILTQINIGPTDGFFITDETQTWDEYFAENKIAMVKTFVYLKVKLIFDPPSSNAVIESINRTISELEYRLYLEGDKTNNTSEGGENNEQ